MNALRPINLEGIPIDDQYLTETKKQYSTLMNNSKENGRYKDQEAFKKS